MGLRWCLRTPTSGNPFESPHLKEIVIFWNYPHPVTVTTRMIPFLVVGNPYKPSFVTVTRLGVDLSHLFADISYCCWFGKPVGVDLEMFFFVGFHIGVS